MTVGVPTAFTEGRKRYAHVCISRWLHDLTTPLCSVWIGIVCISHPLQPVCKCCHRNRVEVSGLPCVSLTDLGGVLSPTPVAVGTEQNAESRFSPSSLIVTVSWVQIATLHCFGPLQHSSGDRQVIDYIIYNTADWNEHFFLPLM